MKKKFCILLAMLTMIAGGGILPVSGQAESHVTMIADFETDIDRAHFKTGQYNFFEPAYSESDAVRASGNAAVKVTFGKPNGNIHQFYYAPDSDIDLTGADYVLFYFCNQGNLPLGINFSAQTFIITEDNVQLTNQPDFWKNYLGGQYEQNHDFGACPAEIFDESTGQWSLASREAVGDANNAQAPGFTIPAGFDGFVRVPLSNAEKIANCKGLGFTMNAGSIAAGGQYPHCSEYEGTSFVLDDIMLLGGQGDMELETYFASTLTPKGLTGVAPTGASVRDAKILGVTSEMEYRPVSSDGSYIVCTGTEINGLAAGDYQVRFIGSAYNALVTVPAFVPEDTVFLSDMYTDHMVIQRGKPITISGTCSQGNAVTVRFAGQTKTSSVTQGAWSVTLDAMETNSQPQNMEIATDDQTKVIKDILIGDVWLCSGQSNMDLQIGQLTPKGQLPYAAIQDNAQIRYFGVPCSYAETPQGHFSKATYWSVPSSVEILKYSAYAYSFAASLQQETGVPIGIVDSSYGGTAIQHWLSEEALAKAGTRYNESMYNSMIAPIKSFPIKGILWYQGESNIQQTLSYTKLFQEYVALYREIFHDEQLPIITTQLPRYNGAEYPKWADFRLEQWDIASRMEQVEIVCGIDLGEANQLHPSDKYVFGNRAGQLTLNKVYHLDFPGLSAYPRSILSTKDGWKISFSDAASGLEIRDGELRELYLVKKDGTLVKAEAQTPDDGSIEIRNNGLDDVVAIQYACSKVPEVNLYTKNGLPVAPFYLTLKDAPEGLNGKAPSGKDKTDGRITGVTVQMEYRSEAETAYHACADGEINGLVPGIYYVRYIAAGKNMGVDAAVTVPEPEESATDAVKKDSESEVKEHTANTGDHGMTAVAVLSVLLSMGTISVLTILKHNALGGKNRK